MYDDDAVECGWCNDTCVCKYCEGTGWVESGLESDAVHCPVCQMGECTYCVEPISLVVDYTDDGCDSIEDDPAIADQLELYEYFHDPA